jgi:5-methylcytosine-specific restriction protein B
MKVSEILNRLSSSDINNAILAFENISETRKGIDSKYTMVHGDKEFPARDLVMRATNYKLKHADNPTSFTSIIAKQKLIELGFTKFKNENMSFRYYLKKVSKQDVGKTTVVNEDAITSFFDIWLPSRNDSKLISLKYLPDNKIDKNVLIRRKQDCRIFLDRTRFKQDNLLLFENLGNNNYSLIVISSYDSKFKAYNELLVNNFLLTNNIELNTKSKGMIEDGKNQYAISSKKIPLNQILYGPPGTGKTDATVEKSLEILGLNSEDRIKNRKIFKSLLNDQIFFLTMHPSYSYEDFVQGIKPHIQYKQKEYPNILVVAHIQDEAANDAVNNYKEDILNEYTYDNLVRNHKIIFKDDLLIIRDRENLIGYAEVSHIESDSVKKKLVKCPNCGRADLRKRKNLIPKYLCVDCRNEFENPIVEEKEVTKYTAKFKTPLTKLHLTKDIIIDDIINYNPQVSIQQVKRSALNKIFDSSQNDGTLLFKVQDGLFVRTSKIARENKENKYIIIIDEINRANISKVFGELVTLVEADKRIGEVNELFVNLPSGETFSVPSNLYIIGTMNTADKSIALVDIALRRRFQFIPLYPDSKVIINHCKSIDNESKAKFMDDLNAKLRIDKGVDFQIGHAYFLKNNLLADVINENIIPLLVEYLRNDLEKVKKLLDDLGRPVDEVYYKETGLLRYNG